MAKDIPIEAKPKQATHHANFKSEAPNQQQSLEDQLHDLEIESQDHIQELQIQLKRAIEENEALLKGDPTRLMNPR